MSEWRGSHLRWWIYWQREWDNSRNSILPIGMWLSPRSVCFRVREVLRSKALRMDWPGQDELRTLPERDQFSQTPPSASITPHNLHCFHLQNKDSKLFCLECFQHPRSPLSQGECYQRITPSLINSPNQTSRINRHLHKADEGLASAILDIDPHNCAVCHQD